MNQEYSYDQVYDATKRGFDALYKLSRNAAKAKWRELSPEDRQDVARGLVHLRHVGKNPAKYLSRAETADAWNARAKQFAADHSTQDTRVAYHIVPSPVGMAEGPISNIWFFANGRGALGGSLWNDWYTLADQFMNYDYNVTSTDEFAKEHYATQNAEKLMTIAERMSDRAAEVTSPLPKRMLLQLAHKFKSYQR